MNTVYISHLAMMHFSLLKIIEKKMMSLQKQTELLFFLSILSIIATSVNFQICEKWWSQSQQLYNCCIKRNTYCQHVLSSCIMISFVSEKMFCILIILYFKSSAELCHFRIVYWNVSALTAVSSMIWFSIIRESALRLSFSLCYITIQYKSLSSLILLIICFQYACLALHIVSLNQCFATSV